VPLISKHFPGISPLTVYELTFDWWRVYLAQAKAIEAHAKELNKRKR